MSRKNDSWVDFLPIILVTTLFFSQIIVGVYLLSMVSQIEILAYFGVGLYVFAGVVFGWLPVREFRKNGNVQRGNSYIHTTQLVDTGIYSIVRHPQYLTFMLWAVAGILLFQHWIIILLGISILPLTYLDLINADNDALEKFGADYEIYMEKVPRANFLLGIVRRYTKRQK